MNKAAKVMTGLAMAAGLTVSGASIAQADIGDGNLACNRGEICLSEHAGGNGGQRHFYYGAEHSEAGNFTSGVPVYHNASAVWNRDTCSGVRVEESGDWTNDTQYFPSNSGGWVNLSYDLNDENARHWRTSNC